MLMKIFQGIFFYRLTLVLSKEAELPLCPTNVLYFPQNLPMHCRMPTGADFPGFPGQVPMPTVPPFYQSLPPNKQPLPIPIPVPPGVPGPFPNPGPFPGPMTGPISLPAPMPMPIPLTGGPAHKLPVIVMPFYSPDSSFKKTNRPNLSPRPYRPRKWRIRHKRRRPLVSSSDRSSSTDTETDTSADLSSSLSTEFRGWWKDRRNRRRLNGPNKMRKRKHNQRRQLLTPVLQYVTKDGYVIFEKKISKNEAKDWMSFKKNENEEVKPRISPDVDDMESNEPNNNHSREKEMVTEGTVELMTKRNLQRLKRVKVHKNKGMRKKS